MDVSKSTKLNLIFNILFLLSFSAAVNSQIIIPNINIVFYIFFHLAFIYLLFYHYHFTIYFILFVYGLLFDIFLLNNIGTHLISFILFISLYNFLKKFLFQLNSSQITIIIFITLIFILIFENIIAYFLDDYIISFDQLYKFFFISIIIFIPSIILFTKLDK